MELKEEDLLAEALPQSFASNLENATRVGDVGV
jgi:hypothetical protein